MRSTVSAAFAPDGLRIDATDPALRLGWNEAVTTALHFPGRVRDEECRRLAALARRFPAEPGRTTGGPEKRRNSVRWLPLYDETRWAYEFLGRIFLEANVKYSFELSGFVDALQFIEYREGDHIDWHLDCGAREASTRKLVATILLSRRDEYRGGEIEFAGATTCGSAEALGSVTVFPGYLAHRVTPVISGERRVLVAWAHGPAFR